MAYVKHTTLGNKHIADAEVAQHVADGWVCWPRTKEQKAGMPDRVRPVPQVVPNTRETMIAAAAAEGIKIDGRWSDARIAAEMAKRV